MCNFVLYQFPQSAAFPPAGNVTRAKFTAVTVMPLCVVSRQALIFPPTIPVLGAKEITDLFFSYTSGRSDFFSLVFMERYYQEFFFLPLQGQRNYLFIVSFTSDLHFYTSSFFFQLFSLLFSSLLYRDNELSFFSPSYSFYEFSACFFF